MLTLLDGYMQEARNDAMEEARKKSRWV